MFKTALRASCELWIKNRRDGGMKWRLGKSGVYVKLTPTCSHVPLLLQS